ncbi:hypothetical protein HMF7854_01715 [Sphingomonas ginkgonis]|uniref:EF-hand domain-containing protein n=1 Tax=Sphingomonas ginkgonis TaxID=2315330 RepID=A0A3R9YGX5_9SPHN|nr:hypothetical protein [Sphingomonas ginkgonis]RST29685.1 hypothetical protein HMF7854_01715 [Sphingomonas ginkgonis]
MKKLVAGTLAFSAVWAAAGGAAAMVLAQPMAGERSHETAGGRTMARADVAQHVQQLFARFDANHDGVLTPDEIAAATGGGMRGGHGRGGADGESRGRGMGGMGGMGARLFAMADANGDGRVTLAEAQAAALAHFDMMDANHDGLLTPDERQAMRQKMMDMRNGN